MDRVELVSVLGSVSLLLVVLELIRQRRLAENYSLLWLLTAIALLTLALSRELLDVLAGLVGIFYPPAALFVVGFGFILLILLQFSVVISRRARENKELAQQLGLLQWKIERLHEELRSSKTDRKEVIQE